MENQKEKVLSVKNLVISFKTDHGLVHAVRDVSFDLYKGETLCIVGESGSGKSVTNKAIMGISAKNAIIENGQILYEGQDLVRVSEEEFHLIRGNKIGMIFQDPLSALNPVMKIGKQIIETTMINRNILKKKYNSLISKELTELRNNEANSNYNITKISNEISLNEATVKDYSELIKEKNKLAEKLQSNLKDEKKKECENSLSEIEDKLKSLDKKVSEYISVVSSNKEKDLEKYSRRIDKYSSNTDFKSDLDKQINECKLNVAKTHLELTKEYDVSNFDFDDIVSSYKKRNEYLSKVSLQYKKDYKYCEKPLKEALKISKVNAKIEVKKYYDEISKIHNDNLSNLESELNSVNEKIKTLEEKIGPEETLRIHAAIKFNDLVIKKETKKSQRNREINISKITKKELELKLINNDEYESYLKDVAELKEKIKKENEDFINKTKITKAEAKRMALEVMKEVGIPLPERRFKQYPFEFSGGMRQRIVIAIALTANPDVLICDEPTTALDVTIQAQILELINKLKKERNLSCIFITHDLGVVANMADRVAVMYAGKIVEYGLANEVFFEPKHPYTWALLSSIPDVDSKEKLEAIPGTPPDMLYPPEGDAFALRSKYAMAIDFKYEPPYFKVSDTHYAATWLLYPGAPKVEMPAIVKTRIENSLKEEEERIKKESEKGAN